MEWNDWICKRKNERVLIRVINLYEYPSFNELYLHHGKPSIGHLEKETPNSDDMLNDYSKEPIDKFGVSAIEKKVTE